MENEDFYKLLFLEDETVCLGGFTSINLFPVARQKSISGEFFSINPIARDMDYDVEPMSPRRLDINVSDFRNFLFEMDGVPLENQLEILEKCPLNFTSIVYSGGKSYHAIWSCSESLQLEPHTLEGVGQYKIYWRILAEQINKTAVDLGYSEGVVDSSCQNPSRLSRRPGIIRKSSKKEQKLVYLGALQPSSIVYNIAKNTDIKVYEKTVKLYSGINENIKNKKIFEVNCPGILLHKLYWAGLWAKSENMYPELFRLTMWAIDDVGVPKEVFVKILKEKTFPELIKKGYPAHKLENAVNDAYKSKGVF